jgi:predicted RNA methylase
MSTMQKTHSVDKSYIKVYFPQDNIDASKLQMTDVGLYSVTYWKDSNKIIKIIQKYFPDTPLENLTITDGTGGLGGNVIPFAKKFYKVNAVEYDETHYKMLTNNVDVFGLSDKTEIIQGDYSKLWDRFKQDVIFIDPPWGGVDYKKKNKLRLYLGEVEFGYFVRKLIKNKASKLIVLKVPFNFYLSEFIKKLKINITRISKYRFKKYLIIVIKT